MRDPLGQEDRRQCVRVSPKGTAILHAGTDIVRGRITDLSCHGLAVQTWTPAPEHLLGDTAEIELRLDGQAAAWLSLNGQVLRIGATSMALRLDVVPPSFERMLEEAVSSSYAHDRLLSIVLVDSRPKRRKVMTEAFRADGCAVIDVSTPLEAIVRLGESDFEPDLIAIADSLPEAISDELRRFVDEAHPHAKLVTMDELQRLRSSLRLTRS